MFLLLFIFLSSAIFFATPRNGGSCGLRCGPAVVTSGVECGRWGRTASGEIHMGVFHQWGYPKMDGLFPGKSHEKLMIWWFGGTHISGNLHIIKRSNQLKSSFTRLNWDWTQTAWYYYGWCNWCLIYSTFSWGWNLEKNYKLLVSRQLLLAYTNSYYYNNIPVIITINQQLAYTCYLPVIIAGHIPSRCVSGAFHIVFWKNVFGWSFWVMKTADVFIVFLKFPYTV